MRAAFSFFQNHLANVHLLCDAKGDTIHRILFKLRKITFGPMRVYRRIFTVTSDQNLDADVTKAG